MGHYDYFRDIVMLSVTLDAPDVPDFVIDYVMYHELLHKAMGAEVVNGRRYAHTPAFREAERKFPRYDEAEAFLQETAHKLAKT
jgi:predicted metal-dependent hydrolase